MPSRSDLIQNVNNAQKIVNRILCLAKSSSVAIAVRAAPCPNAIAVNCADKKYILFSTDYLEQVMNSADSSVIYGIFAHEVGHLIRGDAWLGGNRKHEAELNADKFAGHIMGLVNFPKQVAISTLTNVNVDSTKTHPAKVKRELKIEEGWINGQANRKKIDTTSLEYIMACKLDSDSPFRISYGSLIESKNSHKLYQVQCAIQGDSGKLKTIKSITYFLHPYYFEENSLRYEGNQVLPLEIWGSFELRASVVCVEDGVTNEYLLGETILVIDKKTGKRVTKLDITDVYADDIATDSRREKKVRLMPHN
ncbi:M48 family metalloprotease [Spirosoma pollinicola]|uniref:Uncharacterized protein n=1 Tax=Spirosoma pollinicola TaxID=2057025 RepID=A0A2K8YTD4_9BACT|nr:hypothetical protein [Spirosoma pollinicola]AUD00883.1 hypothetical protein CWM47_03060 [Spirosoma pollinicola]